MKKLSFLFALLCAFFSSCSDEKSESIVPSSGNLPQVVTIRSNNKVTRTSNVVSKVKVLSFSNEVDFDNFVKLLKSETPQQRAKCIESLGFECLAAINESADKELDEIGAESTSEDVFRTKYEAYKNKYAGILVPNNFDSTDLSLYLPETKDTAVAPYLVGKCNKVFIAGKLCEIPFLNQMNEKDRKIFAVNYPEYAFSKMTRIFEKDYENKDAWPVNSFKQMDGGKKTIFNCKIENNKIIFYFGFQKKMWYGYKRDYMSCFFRLANMKGLTNVGNPAVGQTLYHPSTCFWGAIGNYMAFGTAEVSFGDVVINPAPIKDAYNVTGEIYVWNEKMMDKDSNNNIIYQVEHNPLGDIQTKFPSFSVKNSYPCKINLVGKR